MVRAISVLVDSGVNISIHAESLPKSDDWSVHDILPWIDILENEGGVNQDEIVVAIHPQQSSGNESADDLRLGTIKILRMLAEVNKSLKRDYRFALENQRYRGFADPGTSFDGIYSMWAGINSPAVGICWDFGHGFANHIKNNQQRIPTEEFIAATIHTHIHDLSPAGSTHWPFAENVVPLEEFTSHLAVHGYKGIFNLELGFDRFAGVDGKRGLLTASINRLSQLIAS
jgi:sugar phosphate isomerase/epimerase